MIYILKVILIIFFCLPSKILIAKEKFLDNKKINLVHISSFYKGNPAYLITQEISHGVMTLHHQAFQMLDRLLKVDIQQQDDAYDPIVAEEIAQQFADENKIYATILHFGAAGAKKVLPQLGKIGIPYLFPIAGVDLLNNPEHAHATITLRANIAQESRKIIQTLKSRGLTKIGLIVQNDVLGNTISAHMQRICKEEGIPSPLVGSLSAYDNAEEIKNALNLLQKNEPQVIVLGATYDYASRIVKEAVHLFPNIKFAGFSIVGVDMMMDLVADYLKGALFSQVVPDPRNIKLPLVQRYQEAMKKIGRSKFTWYSLEGFIAAELLAKAFQDISRRHTPLSRLDLFKTILSMKVDLEGYIFDCTPRIIEGKHVVNQGSDYVSIMEIKDDGTYVILD